MNKVKYIFLLVFMGFTLNIFADEIFFLSPQPVEMVEKSLKIQIEDPGLVKSVNVYIESKMQEGAPPLWSGTLDTKNAYTVEVDVSSFDVGAYEVKVEYFMRGDDHEGDVTFWVYKDLPEEGKYF